MQSAFPRSVDVVVIGGSYAGMSAALQLARARRRVLIIDGGEPRNRNVAHAHGFLGRDGASPAHLREEARAQLFQYPTVWWHEDKVVAAVHAAEGGFQVDCLDGARFLAQRLVLAYGLVDDLPPLEGLQERWGRSVFNCPYCHGYELGEGRIAVLASAEHETGEQAILLSGWGKVTLYCLPGSVLDPSLDAPLAERGISIERSPVRRIRDEATLELEDGRSMVAEAVFLSPHSPLASPISERLGCGLEDGGCITTDSAKQTTVDGVFACGDIGRKAGNIALAVSEGTLAGIAAHQSLMGVLER